MKYLTANEVADILKLEVHAVRRYIKNGNLQGKKVGRQYLISQEALEKFMK